MLLSPLPGMFIGLGGGGICCLCAAAMDAEALDGRSGECTLESGGDMGSSGKSSLNLLCVRTGAPDFRRCATCGGSALRCAGIGCCRTIDSLEVLEKENSDGEYSPWGFLRFVPPRRKKVAQAPARRPSFVSEILRSDGYDGGCMVSGVLMRRRSLSRETLDMARGLEAGDSGGVAVCEACDVRTTGGRSSVGVLAAGVKEPGTTGNGLSSSSIGVPAGEPSNGFSGMSVFGR